MAKIPVEVKKLLEALKTELPKILGKDLFGVYLYGSLTYNAFNPRTSDVDVIAILNRELNTTQLWHLKAFQNQLIKTFGKQRKKGKISGKDLELTYINRHKLLQPATVFEHWGGKIRKAKHWSSLDPIHGLNLKISGITLFGPHHRNWMPSVSRKLLQKAL